MTHKFKVGYTVEAKDKEHFISFIKITGLKPDGYYSGTSPERPQEQGYNPSIEQTYCLSEETIIDLLLEKYN